MYPIRKHARAARWVRGVALIVLIQWIILPAAAQ